MQEHMHEAEEAYNASLKEAAEKLPAAIDQLMRLSDLHQIVGALGCHAVCSTMVKAQF